MKAYKGSFIKKNGEIRKMLFAHLDDLPESLLQERIVGTGVQKSYPEGMQLVWDLEADSFRIFNHNAVVDHPQEVE